MGMSAWIALISVAGNIAQAGSLKAVNGAKRILEARLQKQAVALAQAEDAVVRLQERVSSAESAGESESRARKQAEALVRQSTTERDAERAEHQKAKASLARAQADLARTVAERDLLAPTVQSSTAAPTALQASA